MSAPVHQLFVSHVAFGHNRPMLALALNLLTIHSHLHVTMLAAKQLEAKLVPQLKRFKATEDVLARFHLVFFGEVEKDNERARLIQVLDLEDYVHQTFANFSDAYAKVLKGEPLFDVSTGTLIPTFTHKLTRVVSDFLLLAGVSPAKVAIEAEVGRSEIELHSFAPIHSPFIATWFFRPPDSFMPGLIEKCLEVSRAPGNRREDAEMYEKVAEHNDDVLHVPGCGDIYAYELQPSVARWRAKHDWLEIMHAMFQSHFQRHLCSGMITPWEGSFTAGPPNLLQEMAKKTFDNYWEVGPQLSPAEWEEHMSVGTELGRDEFVVEERKGEVMEFLDRAVREEGEKSVLVISFGSLFAIPLLSHIKVLLSVLAELKIRFIFAKGVCDDAIVDEVQRHCAQSEGRGMLATWIPQNAVLAHPASSFFLTHCGSNSVQEAILHSVPMIAWPGAVDQAMIALELSTVHKVAFELLQTRVEYNVGRPTMRGPVAVGTDEAVRAELMDVFGKMRGEEGEEMRERVKAMREKMVRSCRVPGGKSWEAMRALGQ